jgi:hypothetical protein
MLDNSRFFIVGSGRSGSTLLRLLLLGHSRLYIPPETWFIRELVDGLPLNARLSSAQVRQAVQIISTNYRWTDMGIEEDELLRWATTLEVPTLRDVIDLIYDHLLKASGRERLGDKTPPYIHIVPQLAVLYPTAKFIHLIRDGRDVATSFIKMGYECRCYDGERFEWTAAIRRGLSYRDTIHATQILEVRYETLVSDVEATIRRICDFLGEDFETGMLDVQRRVSAVPKRERSIHGKLDQPITAEAIATWRRTLSPTECFVMESCLGTDLSRLGYRLRFQSARWQPLLRAAGFALRLAAPLLNRVIPALGRRNLLPKPFYF